MTDYTIEQLEKTFKDHSEAFENNIINEKNLGFSISKALHVICREINEIKSTLERFEKDIY